MMHTICKYADDTELVISDIIKRENGEDKPTLYYISASDDETMYKAGFEELHYGLWGKVLTDEEYNEITKREEER